MSVWTELMDKQISVAGTTEGIEEYARQRSIQAVMGLYWTTQTSDQYPTLEREDLVSFMKEKFGMDEAEVDELIEESKPPLTN